MKKNVGSTDRFVRVIFGIILLIIYMAGAFDSSLLSWALLIISAVLILTSFANFCPFYAIFRIDTFTRKRKKRRIK